MATKKAARSRCSNSRAITSLEDAHILAHDVLLGAFGALVMVGVPLIMAILKQWGWW